MLRAGKSDKIFNNQMHEWKKGRFIWKNARACSTTVLLSDTTSTGRRQEKNTKAGSDLPNIDPPGKRV